MKFWQFFLICILLLVVLAIVLLNVAYGASVNIPARMRSEVNSVDSLRWIRFVNGDSVATDTVGTSSAHFPGYDWDSTFTGNEEDWVLFKFYVWRNGLSNPATFDIEYTPEHWIIDSLNDVIATLATLATSAEVSGLNDIAAVDVWNVAFATGFAAGSMGDSLNNSTYVQGVGATDTAKMKVMAENNPDLFYGPTVAGTGSDTMIWFAVDTSADPDAAIEAVKLTYYTPGGVKGTPAWTDVTGGNAVFALDPASGYTMYAKGGNSGNYIWYSQSFDVSGSATDTIFGYSISTSPFDTSNYKACNVGINVLNNDGSYAVGVWVTAQLSGSNLIDSAGNPIYNAAWSKKTNDTGHVEFTCVWSSYLIPETKWLFTVQSGGNLRRFVTVPRSDSMTVDFKDWR